MGEPSVGSANFLTTTFVFLERHECESSCWDYQIGKYKNKDGNHWTMQRGARCSNDYRHDFCRELTYEFSSFESILQQSTLGQSP